MSYASDTGMGTRATAGYTSGGQLHFDDGSVIDGKREWHKFNGRQHHWNSPHDGGVKYSVILYRSNGPTKSELVRKRRSSHPEPGV